MTDRRRLPNRRHAETFHFHHEGLNFVATIGRFGENFDGSVAEIFLNTNMKSGSLADINAADAAFAASLALQYGCPLKTLRMGMKRNADGGPQGPLGAALDELKKRGE